MTRDDLIEALKLPPGSRVDRRVPKTLLVEQGAPTAADKRRINEGIEEVRWVATLKPNTISVPAFRDSVREYLEVAVLSVVLRTETKFDRLAELIHRAVPYPVFLVLADSIGVTISLAHKRWSQVETGATVLDGESVVVSLGIAEPSDLLSQFQQALSLVRQPRDDLYSLYQGWVDTLLAFLAARYTGVLEVLTSPDQAAARHEALRDCARLNAEITRLRLAAAKERQVPRQVALNVELKSAEVARAASIARL